MISELLVAFLITVAVVTAAAALALFVYGVVAARRKREPVTRRPHQDLKMAPHHHIEPYYIEPYYEERTDARRSKHSVLLTGR